MGAAHRHRLGELRRRRGRHALFTRRADHAAERAPACGRLGVPYRRRRGRPRRGERDVVPGHADPVRGHALPVLAVQPRDRARSAQRQAALDVRSEGRAPQGQRIAQDRRRRVALPRRGRVGRREDRGHGAVRAPHLRRRDRRAPHRARRAHGQGLRRLRQRRHRRHQRAAEPRRGPGQLQLAARDLRGPRHRRQRDRRQRAERHAARLRARLRRAHGRAAVVVGSRFPPRWPRKTGAGNVWAPISVDTARGLVVLPTSSPSPDYFGGERAAEMPYTTAVVTLNARTGERVWHFQTHPPQPVGLRSRVAARARHHPPRRRGAGAVVAQATKMGFVFVLDRETGASLFPIVERVGAGERRTRRGHRAHAAGAVAPAADRAGRRSSRRTRSASCTSTRRRASARWPRYDNRGLYTPPSVRGSIVYPFFGGGSNWGSVAFDPESNLLVRQHDEPGRHGAGHAARGLRRRAPRASRRPGDARSAARRTACAARS